jgi:hypothetical protein
MKTIRPNRFYVVCSLLVCSIVAMYVAGCQSTSLVQKTAQARTAYTGVVEAVNVELTNGRITRDDWRKYGEPARQAARAALDVMDAEATKDPTQWQAAFDAFNQALSDLNIGKAQAESASKPATQSSLSTRSPIHAGIPFEEVAALVALGIGTLQKMYAEGRQETNDEETAQLADARAAQKVADDQLDKTLEEDQSGNA